MNKDSLIKVNLKPLENKSIEDLLIFNSMSSKQKKLDLMRFSQTVHCFQTLLETKSLRSEWNQQRKFTKKAERSLKKENPSPQFTSLFLAVSKKNTMTFTSSEVSVTSSILTTSHTTNHQSALSEPKLPPKSWKSKLTSFWNCWSLNQSSNSSGTKVSSCTQSDTRRVCNCWRNTSQRKSWEGLSNQLRWNWWRKVMQI